jgi:hypothetical protein
MRFLASVFFSGINPNEPESYSKRFSNLVSNCNTANLGYKSGIHGVDSWKKNGRPKISCYCPFNTSFWFPLKQTTVNIVFGWFLKHPEPRKRDDKVGELARDCRELRNCGSQIFMVLNGSSATFLVRNSAINLAVRNIAELRRCGLKLRMPTFAFYCTSLLKFWHSQITVQDTHSLCLNYLLSGGPCLFSSWLYSFYTCCLQFGFSPLFLAFFEFFCHRWHCIGLVKIMLFNNSSEVSF